MKKKRLTWDDYPEIAMKLHKAYPDEDLLNMRDETMIARVRAHGWVMDSHDEPSQNCVDAIMYVWNALRDDDDYDDSKYDAHV